MGGRDYCAPLVRRRVSIKKLVNLESTQIGVGSEGVIAGITCSGRPIQYRGKTSKHG